MITLNNNLFHEHVEAAIVMKLTRFMLWSLIKN